MDNRIFSYNEPFSLGIMDKEFDLSTLATKEIQKFLETKNIKADIIRLEFIMFSDMSEEIRNSTSKSVLNVYKHLDGKIEAHFQSNTTII